MGANSPPDNNVVQLGPEKTSFVEFLDDVNRQVLWSTLGAIDQDSWSGCSCRVNYLPQAQQIPMGESLSLQLGSLDDELVAGVGQAVQGGRPDQSKYSGWQISSKPTKRSLNSVPCSGEKEVAAPA